MQSNFGEDGLTLKLFLKRTAPFSILWTLTNYLYLLALKKLTATDVSALFCCNKAFVFLLSWIVLKDRFMGIEGNGISLIRCVRLHLIINPLTLGELLCFVEFFAKLIWFWVQIEIWRCARTPRQLQCHEEDKRLFPLGSQLMSTGGTQGKISSFRINGMIDSYCTWGRRVCRKISHSKDYDLVCVVFFSQSTCLDNSCFCTPWI